MSYCQSCSLLAVEQGAMSVDGASTVAVPVEVSEVAWPLLKDDDAVVTGRLMPPEQGCTAEMCPHHLCMLCKKRGNVW